MNIERLRELVRDLLPIAMKDGAMTEEERGVIESVKENVEAFAKAYMKAMEDGIITDEENASLLELWEDVYRRPLERAKKDRKISKEELQMLLRVLHTVVMNR